MRPVRDKQSYIEAEQFLRSLFPHGQFKIKDAYEFHTCYKYFIHILIRRYKEDGYITRVFNGIYKRTNKQLQDPYYS